ncbi:MAG: hypothetical protein ACYS8Z_15390 [Planctomycetota bacterium]|jgi:hypothetical protein
MSKREKEEKADPVKNQIKKKEDMLVKTRQAIVNTKEKLGQLLNIEAQLIGAIGSLRELQDEQTKSATAE